MAWLRRRPAPQPGPVVLEGEFDCEVVGESYYQEGFLAVCGPKCPEGVQMECLAVLQPQPSNPYDPLAVAVLVDGHHLGHLRREVAANVQPQILRYQRRNGPCVVRARIVGGWLRDNGDEGHFGIWLRMPERIA